MLHTLNKLSNELVIEIEDSTPLLGEVAIMHDSEPLSFTSTYVPLP